MSTRRHVFQRFMGTRRRRQFAMISPFIALTALVVQMVVPVSVTHARQAVTPLAALSYGCTSPSDCVAKMTLPEKEGQITQVEKNAFTQAGNALTDITTYFIGSAFSGRGGGRRGAGGTAPQLAGIEGQFPSLVLQTRPGAPPLSRDHS